ncbi:MAG TPA: YncE family protein [Terriglobales bacterium]|nr:YncE family protein [Terriglobales bacterium]
MGLQMRLLIRRSAAVLNKAAAGVVCLVLLTGCGDTFRPVANPIPQPGGNPVGTIENSIVLATNGTGAGTTTNINVSGDTVVAVLPVGVYPVHAAIIAADLFIANRDGDSLSVYPSSAGAGASVTTVTLPAGAKPLFVASTDNTNVYVAQSGTNSVGVVSLATLAEVNSITDASISTPAAIAQLPNGSKIYVANKGSGKVTVIDSATFVIKGAITVGTTPSAIVASPDGNCVYVANQGSGTVTVINSLNDATPVAAITVGAGPSFLRFDSKLQRVYVANTGGNSVSIINHAADCSASTATTVMVGTAPTSVAALSDGTRAYVANSGSGNVSVILTSSNTVKTFGLSNAIAVGANPVSVGSSADGTKVVVANNSGSISVIQTSTDTVIPGLNLTPTTGAIPVAPNPRFVLMNP